MKENEKWMDSIQGKIDQFNNSLQTFWMNLIDSDAIKFIVDLGTAVLKFVDAMGLLPTAAGAFTAYKLAAKGLKEIFDSTNVSAKGLRQQISQYITQQTEAAAASKATTVAKTEEAAATNASSTADATETATSTANAVANTTQAEASKIVQKEKTEEAVKVQGAAMADAEETASSTANAVANVAQGAGGTKTGIGAATGIFSKIAGAATKAGSAIKVLGVALGKAALVMVAVKAVTWTLSKAWDYLDKNIIHRAENIKKEVTELNNVFKETKETLDSNLTALTTSSDTNVYATLQDEFNALIKGVDQYGNNISLTSDQYERYKEICEKIVGIQPSIAAGYDSATKAIGNNASVLSQLIELQKIQARQNTEKLISDENFGKIVEDANNDYKNTLSQSNTNKNEKYTNAWKAISKAIEGELPKEYISHIRNVTTDLNQSGSNKDEMMSYVLKQIGYTAEEAQDIVAKYWNKYSNYYNTNQFMADYYDEIKDNTEKFGKEYKLTLDNTFYDIEKAITSAGSDLKEAQDSLVDDFLLVPQGEKAGPYYDQLNDASKKFVTEWIKNSSQFKIDQNQTEDAAIANRDKIIEMVKKIANEDFKLDFEGKQITGQDFLDKFYNLDSTNINWGDYKTKAQALFDEFWNQIGGDQNEFGVTEADLKVALGIEFIDDESKDNNKMHETRSQISDKVDKSETEIQDWLNTLPPTKVKKFYEIEWNKVDGINSLDDVLNEIDKQLVISKDVVSVKLYSELSDSIEKFNEVQKQTAEIITDNTEVTQEYKDSLTELGISEEDLSDCFDENNKLVVKNASRLKQLVSAAKTNISTQTTLARAQARLKYKELYKQLALLTNGQLKNAQANKTQINLLYQEMSAVQKTIAKYSLLEQQLAGVTKTYSEFEEAQSTDSEYDYMSKTESMLVAAIQAYETGELGTETAQVSIKALVPDIVFEDPDIKTVEDKAEAAHDYLMETLNKYFVMEFDEDTGEIQSAEMKMGNLRKFIEDGFENSVFSGEDWQHFEWSDEFLGGLEEAPDKLQYFADKMKVTKEVALAVIQEINNHDIEWLNGDYGSLFDQIVPETLDTKLQNTTARMAELNVQLANGKITQEEYEAAMGGLNMQLSNGAITQDQYNTKLEELNNQLANGKITQEEYTRQVGGLNGQLVEQQTAAVNVCNSFIDLNNKMDESQKKLEEYQRQLQSETDPEKIKEINKQYTQELQNYEGYLKQKKELENKYGPMTEYTVSIALEEKGIDVDNIDNELTKTKSEINSSIEKLNNSLDGIEVSINDDGEIEYKITDATDEEQLNNLKELGALNEDGTVNIDLLYAGLTDEQKAEVDKLGSLQEKQNLINYYLSMDGVDTVQTSIDNLTTTLNNIYDLLAESPIFKANVEPETKTALDNLLDKVRSWVGEHVASFVSKEKKEVTTEYKYITSPTSTSNSRQNLMYVNGTAHSSGSFGLPSSEHDALVGELGTEMVVDPRTGRYYTVGDNGAEMVDLPKGAIIFNHKQTEELLKNGYVTSRGKMLADGTAHAEGNAHVTFFPNYTTKNQWTGTGYSSWDDLTYDATDALNNAADSISDSADSLSDATDDFEEVFDWVEVRLEEIDETLDLLNAKLENAVGYSAQNSIIDQMLGVNDTKMSNLQAGLQEYANYASKLLAQIPAQYQKAAQDGAIAIEEFAGEADEVTLDAIKNYREWAQKVADLTQQIEELRTEIADLAKQKFDNVSNQYDNIISLIENANEKLDAQVSLMEDRGYVAAKQYYESMVVNTKQQSAELANEKKALQAVLDQQVKLNNIKVGSDAWYEMVNALYEVDAAIVECTSDLEKYQNAINDIYWDNFDQLINRLDYLNNETQGLIDLMDNADMVSKPDNKNGWGAKDVEWTKEGIASLGLYAQQMEIAEYQAKQYAKAIDDLNKDYADGKYSENEYLDKLDELTSAQYDSIESYYDAQDAIKNLNETRIDAIKTGIEKEIDAYSELISKKKEELDAEKDLYDFQKSTAEQQKSIADIQRKLSALSGDNSASSIAKRKKLEAELAQAKADLEESYYNRSVDDRSNALDKELEDFQNEKNAEIEKWESYLENIEQVVADSLGIVQANASGVYDTLNAKAQEYDLTLSDAIMTPWQDGVLAISDYQTTFDTAMSSTWDQLENIKMKWQEIIDKMAEAAKAEVSRQQNENKSYTSATYTPPAPTPATPSKPAATQKSITVGGQINAGSARIYAASNGTGGGKQYYSSNPIYTVLEERNGYLKVRHVSLRSGVTGWFKKSDVKAYAKGSKEIDKDQLGILDELGPELQLVPDGNGRLSYIKRGTAIIPSDISENLMKLGQLNPQDVLDRNRPAITPSKSVVNNEINIDCSVGELVHIECCDQNTLPDVEKIVDKAFNKHMQDINNSLKRFAR